MTDRSPDDAKNLSSKRLALFGLAGAAAYFSLVEHREHVLVWLPYLILLACPLMHIMMHRRHGTDAGMHDRDVAEAYERGVEEGKGQTGGQRNADDT